MRERDPGAQSASQAGLVRDAERLAGPVGEAVIRLARFVRSPTAPRPLAMPSGAHLDVSDEDTARRLLATQPAGPRKALLCAPDGRVLWSAPDAGDTPEGAALRSRVPESPGPTHAPPPLHLPLAEAELVAFDLETTGLNSRTDRPVSLGAVVLRDRMLAPRPVLYHLIDPGRPIPPRSSRIHGLTDQAVAGAPSIDQVLPIFRAFLGAAIPTAYWPTFDLAFLAPRLAAAGLPPVRCVLDPARLALALFPDWPDVQLENIALRLGIPLHARHNALGDAVLTGRIMARLLRVLHARGVTTLEQALDVQGGDAAEVILPTAGF